MHRLTRILSIAAVLVGAVIAVGCGLSGQVREAAQQQQIQNDLKVLYFAYVNHIDSHGKGPASWDELLQFSSKSGEDTQSLVRVRDAGYQVKWGVKMSDATEGTAEFVLAQPSGSGPKLMLDGAIRQ